MTQRDQSFMGQPGDQRLRAPTAKGRIHIQSLAAQGSSSQAGKIGLHCRFINEHNAFRSSPNRWQPMGKPIGTLLAYLGAAALRRDQRLFLYVNPRRDSKSAMDE